MTAMLDEKFTDCDYVSQHDDNAYTFGRIGKHNIVIANLSAGIIGTIEATNTVNSMLKSFPEIETGIVLLV